MRLTGGFTRAIRGQFYRGVLPYRAPRPRARRPPGIRLIVTGVSRDTSWQVSLPFTIYHWPRMWPPWVESGLDVMPQDLKDFGREAGNVSYADIDRDHPGEGRVISPY
jgi:splicing factor, arginine/serine-rich 4/5/6